MTTFHFDTWGVVAGYALTPADVVRTPTVVRYSDLSPFVQGYVKAMLSASQERLYESADPALGLELTASFGFSDLHPETLARIMEDCERFQASPWKWVNTVTAGSEWWKTRQRGDWSDASCEGRGFPSLTLHLSDDGKIHFSPA